MNRALDAIVGFATSHRAAVTAVALALTVFFGWGIRYVTIETSYLSYFAEDSPILQATRAVGEYMHSGQASFLVVVDGPEANSISRLDTLRRLAAQA